MRPEVKPNPRLTKVLSFEEFLSGGQETRVKIIDRIFQIQNIVFPESFRETKETLEELIQNFPEGCFLLTCDLDSSSDIADAITGYGISHPGITLSMDKIPESTVDVNSDSYFIHDISVMPEARGGNGEKILLKIEEYARSKGFIKISMIAVGGADNLWKRFGYIQERTVENYGRNGEPGALMSKNLTD